MKKILSQLALLLFLAVNAYSQGAVKTSYNFSVQYGESITVEAVPNNGYRFINWLYSTGEQYNLSNPLVIAGISNDLNIIANFQKITVQIQFSTAGGGNPTGAGTYDWGDEVTINANPWIGREFVHWLDFNADTIFSTEENFTFLAENSLILRPVYQVATYIINIEVNPSDGGTIEEVTPKVYPNPTDGALNIDYNGIIDRVEFINILGGVAKTITSLSNYNDVNISGLNPSTYFLRIYSDNNIFTKSIVKI